MEELLFEEFILIQLILASCFFGFVTVLWGYVSERNKLIRWGLFGFMSAAVIGIPLYYQGGEILTAMKQYDYRDAAIQSYEADHYTTLIVAFFLGIISFMSLVMLRALNRVPKIFLYPVLSYVLLFIIYLGWRSIY